MDGWTDGRIEESGTFLRSGSDEGPTIPQGTSFAPLRKVPQPAHPPIRPSAHPPDSNRSPVAGIGVS